MVAIWTNLLAILPRMRVGKLLCDAMMEPDSSKPYKMLGKLFLPVGKP